MNPSLMAHIIRVGAHTLIEARKKKKAELAMQQQAERQQADRQAKAKAKAKAKSERRSKRCCAACDAHAAQSNEFCVECGSPHLVSIGKIEDASAFSAKWVAKERARIQKEINDIKTKRKKCIEEGEEVKAETERRQSALVKKAQAFTVPIDSVWFCPKCECSVAVRANFCGKCGTKMEERPKESEADRLAAATRELALPVTPDKFSDLPIVIEEWTAELGHHTTEVVAEIESRTATEVAEIDKQIERLTSAIGNLKAPPQRCPQNHVLIFDGRLHCVVCGWCFADSKNASKPSTQKTESGRDLTKGKATNSCPSCGKSYPPDVVYCDNCKVGL